MVDFGGAAAPNAWFWAAQFLHFVAPEAPSHAGKFAPRKEPPPDSSLRDAFSSTFSSSVTPPAVRAALSPPMPTSLDAGRGRNLALTQPISAPRVPPPQSLPAVLFTMNLPESAPAPLCPGSMKSSCHVAPRGRLRIKRSVHQQCDCAQASRPKIEQASFPHGPIPNPQMSNGAGKSGISGAVFRTV